MKALVLAAGEGSRLRPYSLHTPKPLFPAGGLPLLEIIIRRLIGAGCRALCVNTHYLHEQIRDYIAGQNYPVPVKCCYEPEILGTGGAIRNLSDFWDEHPFFVINSDILTDIDLQKLYTFHLDHNSPLTLALSDAPECNHVSVSAEGFVTAFHGEKDTDLRRAFTGIQVADPAVLHFIPPGKSSSIDAYRRMLRAGKTIRAFDASGYAWQDMGTPERYRKGVREILIRDAFSGAWPDMARGCVEKIPLKGDGSDREWLRIRCGNKSLVMADHGIRTQKETVTECDAFGNIGTHLFRQGAAVPRIYLCEPFSGMVFMEDMGDTRLQELLDDTPDIQKLYTKVIDRLTDLWLLGKKNFNPAWCWQTPSYDREVILEKECRYFCETFLQNYLGLAFSYEDFADEFAFLAGHIEQHACTAFMHRDMQSRNIMVKDGEIFFIDFQGGRPGPVQYDLAALLTDPYARLSGTMQEMLREYCMEKLSQRISVNAESFRKGYEGCALSRGLQILAAFAFLSRVKKKQWFAQYIPAACHSLKQILSGKIGNSLPKLRECVMNALPDSALSTLK